MPDSVYCIQTTVMNLVARPCEFEAKFEDETAYRKNLGSNLRRAGRLMATRECNRTGENSKSLKYNGASLTPVSFAHQSVIKNALRSFRTRNREGSIPVAFPPPIPPPGKLSGFPAVV